jgi:hypothetical protein
MYGNAKALFLATISIKYNWFSELGKASIGVDVILS